MLCLFHLCDKVNLTTVKCLESFRNMKFENMYKIQPIFSILVLAIFTI